VIDLVAAVLLPHVAYTFDGEDSCAHAKKRVAGSLCDPSCSKTSLYSSQFQFMETASNAPGVIPPDVLHTPDRSILTHADPDPVDPSDITMPHPASMKITQKIIDFISINLPISALHPAAHNLAPHFNMNLK
jgi:hypothetical protein